MPATCRFLSVKAPCARTTSRRSPRWSPVSAAGVHRPALTPADLEARLWLRAQLAGIGYDASIDRFGTVWGRAPGDAPVILIGSHTDTVPHGGWLDGALGVAYALEIATARAQALGANASRVDVVSFQDEEGTF